MSPAPLKAILLVDHGSVRAEANDMLRRVAALVEAEVPGYHVEVSHMELAEPTIQEGIDRCVAAGARDITVHPYLLSPGRHAMEDIPRLVRAALAKHPGVAFRVTEPLGLHPALARVVVERVEESEAEDGAGRPRPAAAPPEENRRLRRLKE
jgi:sirohydrochlorin ferrochelatase